MNENDPTAVDRDFVAAVDELKKFASQPAKTNQSESKTTKLPNKKGPK
jgi:hypothetical protein